VLVSKKGKRNMFKSKQITEQTLVGLSDAELGLVAGGQPGGVAGGSGGSVAVAVGAAASNSANVPQTNVISASNSVWIRR